MRRALLSFSLAALMAAPGLAQVSVERLPQLLDRLEKSQKAVAGKQDMLLGYQRTTGGSERTRTFVEERLRDLVRSEHENEQLYGEFRQALNQHGLAAGGPKVQVLEAAQKALETTHGQLSVAFGGFYQRLAPAGHAAPSLAAAGAPAAPPAGQIPPPLPGDLPPAAPAATDAGPAASAGPVATAASTAAAPEAPAAPDDSEAAYRATVSEVQAVLTSPTSTPLQKAAAYKKFLELSAQRRTRKQ